LSHQFITQNTTAHGQRVQKINEDGAKWMVKAISAADLAEIKALLEEPGGGASTQTEIK